MNQPLLGNARILDDLVCLKADEISHNGGTNKHCGKSNYSPPPDLQNLALIWKNNGMLVSCKFGQILCDFKGFLEISWCRGILWDFFTFLSNEEAEGNERGFFRYLGDRYRPLLADATLSLPLWREEAQQN